MTMKPSAPENLDLEIQMLFEAIFRKYGYDFRNYGLETSRRRVLHRLALSGMQTISEMQHEVINNPVFADRFLKDLSINVTEMFRDPGFYKALREMVAPMLREARFIKIWHAGCATGEEVYSMAILLKEEGLYDRSLLYATDFNDEVLNKARAGIYPLDKMRDYISNYRQAGGVEDFADYYTARYGAAIMDKSLRKNMVFANHNLTSEEAFEEVQVIVCRNVLIYFNKELQGRVIGRFLNSLGDDGILCLGSKEGLQTGEYENCFRVISDEYRIFQSILTTDAPGAAGF